MLQENASSPEIKGSVQAITLNLQVLHCNEERAITNENSGRFCKKCGKLKLWHCFSKKPGGRNGRDSACKDCRKRAQVSRRKKLRANKHMVIDGESLVIKNRIVGDPLKVDIDSIAMLIANAYHNRSEDVCIKSA